MTSRLTIFARRSIAPRMDEIAALLIVWAVIAVIARGLPWIIGRIAHG